MHHCVDAVEQHPFAGFFAFDVADDAACFFDFFAHVVSKRAGLPVTGAAGNYHAVKQAGHAGGVKYHDVLRLNVFKGIDNNGL